jgi:hypothetical protein
LVGEEMKILLLMLLVSELTLTTTRAATAEVANISFGTDSPKGTQATNDLPQWVLDVRQEGGELLSNPDCWYSNSQMPVGQGRIVITVNRSLMQEDLAMQLLFYADDSADLIVQLSDSNNQVVVLDLFSNVVAVGKEARTDTFIVPLRKFPSATKIVIRRIRGDVKVYGLSIYPVAGVAEGDTATLQELAKILGDPLSPDNQLAQHIRNLADKRNLPLQWRKTDLLTPVPLQSTRPSGSKQCEVDWTVLPFPSNCDWPGAKGYSAELGNGTFLLRGQSIRSRGSFSGPVTISLDTVLEDRIGTDGYVSIELLPDGLSAAEQSPQVFGFYMVYRNNANDGLTIYQRLGLTEDFHPVSRLVWGEQPFGISAGRPYHIELHVGNSSWTVSINGKQFEILDIAIPYKNYQIQINGWQPTVRWHVRNLSVAPDEIPVANAPPH